MSSLLAILVFMANFLKNIMSVSADTQGRVREVLTHPHPALSQECKPVSLTEINSLSPLIDDMIATMQAQDGVGLAAIQIGVPQRVLVYALGDDENTPPSVLINPCIVQKSDEVIDAEEGCLSFPGVYFPVARPQSVTVEAYDEHGNEVRIEGATGMLARVLQHEIDHLDGVMIQKRAKPGIAKQALRAYAMRDAADTTLVTITDNEG